MESIGQAVIVLAAVVGLEGGAPDRDRINSDWKPRFKTSAASLSWRVRRLSFSRFSHRDLMT